MGTSPTWKTLRTWDTFCGLSPWNYFYQAEAGGPHGRGPTQKPDNTDDPGSKKDQGAACQYRPIRTGPYRPIRTGPFQPIRRRYFFFFKCLYLISIVDQTQVGTYPRGNFLCISGVSPLFWEATLTILAGAVLPFHLSCSPTKALPVPLTFGSGLLSMDGRSRNSTLLTIQQIFFEHLLRPRHCLIYLT